MVTKAQLLAGTRYHEWFYVPEFETDGCGGGAGCDGMVKVRPLSDGEQGEIDTFGLEGQTVRRINGETSEREIDLAESARGQMAARRQLVAYGLSVDEQWTAEEVAQLHPAGVRRIAAKVRKLTDGEDTASGKEAGASPEEFRDDRGGADDRGPAPDGDTAGTDPS